MGNSGDPWIPRIGLALLGILASTGLVGGLILANNGHEVPAWLSASIGGYGTSLGLVVLAIYGRSGGNGNDNGNERRVADYPTQSSTGIKAG